MKNIFILFFETIFQPVNKFLTYFIHMIYLNVLIQTAHFINDSNTVGYLFFKVLKIITKF